MVLTLEQERVKDLLKETITILCRNGLQYKTEFSVDALIGITLDKEEVFLVNIRETIQNCGKLHESEENEDRALKRSPRKRSCPQKHTDFLHKKQVTEQCPSEKDALLVVKQEAISEDEDRVIQESINLSESHDSLESVAYKDQAQTPTLTLPHQNPPISGSILNQQSICNSFNTAGPTLPPWNVPNGDLLATYQEPESGLNCDICNKPFSRHKNMLLHRKLHFGIYRCYCPVCHKGFSGSTNLRGHMQIHTNTAEFKCSQCHKAYRYSKDLKRHKASAHKDQGYLQGGRNMSSTWLKQTFSDPDQSTSETPNDEPDSVLEDFRSGDGSVEFLSNLDDSELGIMKATYLENEEGRGNKEQKMDNGEMVHLVEDKHALEEERGHLDT